MVNEIILIYRIPHQEAGLWETSTAPKEAVLGNPPPSAEKTALFLFCAAVKINDGVYPAGNIHLSRFKRKAAKCQPRAAYGKYCILPQGKADLRIIKTDNIVHRGD